MRDSTDTRKSASPVLRVAILGAGQMAGQHARAIARLPELARVTAVVDPHADAVESFRKIVPDAVGFASVDELLASQTVDVVHVCTPPNTHETLTERLLGAGCHVYVEKPFVETRASAMRLARLADANGLKICPGHQLLYEPPTRRAVEMLPALGQLTHVESYFSFRAAKHLPTGRAPLRDDMQLLDILPHPVYVLLDFLERAGEGSTELTAIEIGPRGTVHALVRRGPVAGTLVVTLEGRPVESYLRLVGTNGSIHADYVRSTVQTSIGPGASGIDKLLTPYRVAGQLLAGTTGAMGKRFLKRQTSYPGLAEIFSAFYEAVREDQPSPVSRTNLIDTVAICERIAEALATANPAQPASRAHERSAPVVVTGGTGLLGKEVVRALLAGGESVRVVARRTPPDWERVPGVTYHAADLSEPIPHDVMAGAKTLIHCAAETAGRWEQHQRNTITATERVLDAAEAAGVKQMIQVSSISVMAVPRRGEKLSEKIPFEPDPKTGGPNAWGKIEAEKLAASRCRQAGIELRVVRPSAIIDHRNFDPPGLLGRRIGNIFVAVGMPSHRLGVVDVVFCGETIAWMARHFESAPPVINLFEPELPTKRELIEHLRKTNPDLTVVWLVPLVLHPLSWFAFALQKLLRPGKPAMNVAKMFARLQYDTSLIAGLAPAIRADRQRQQTRSELEATPGVAAGNSTRMVIEDRRPARVG